MPWLVTYTNPGREDSSAVFKSEKKALLESLRLIEIRVKDELEGLEWEEGDPNLELLDETMALLTKAKEPKADVESLWSAYESWREYASETGPHDEDVVVEEVGSGD